MLLLIHTPYGTVRPPSASFPLAHKTDVEESMMIVDDDGKEIV